MTVAAQLRRRLDGVSPVQVAGRLTRSVGLELEARGVSASIGDQLWVGPEHRRIPTEVVALRDDTLVLLPFAPVEGLTPGDPVQASGERFRLRVGPDVVGRVLDALGRPIDGGPALTGDLIDLDTPVPNAMRRQRIAAPLTLGVRAIDTMLPCGQGQRIGIFAGSGVGKSTLLGMVARGTQADVVVVGLVGERGREVREFLEDDLGPGGRDRACVVVATSDEPALVRLRAAFTATRVAEWFRDQGANVLLLVDSLTRVAMAQREVGLAAGEPPTTRGYPPSVFAMLPRLLERSGPGEVGSIAAIYTVLVEGDDMNEPVADHARSILDGHVVLARKLAAAGHFPTIDVLESVSRLASKVCPPDRIALSRRLRQLLAAYAEAKDLVEIGAYVPGTNPDVDEALHKKALIDAFLRQDVLEVADPALSWQQLHSLVSA